MFILEREIRMASLLGMATEHMFVPWLSETLKYGLNMATTVLIRLN